MRETTAAVREHVDAGREHVYLGGEERAELERWIEREQVSKSYVLRMAFRALVGLPVPANYRGVDHDEDSRRAR